ncbi:Glycosyltransferase, catalytic subunit of cellulose synthase and poly-beta-1,6-N-acetylglucosamine synthase [Rathayibacter oskolensis]|uniref:Glycosyltransferase, catalytic subunit of cellulose synthase and poly-beta-1,6-N-acetylglucosamine synthase n=1 Tax=Rathayibacter oskolensis TaxID=1891671 RepID=A0A1X7P7D3_9MICO|nr:glycosyltransferase family 2 protein [Rathayibacter oskolensis]SMH46842.1 Glycosyltransferase, catalytic subunit of cellulose synthase and poly-beta-1,6-N-acetylglucosamine synthase [Rathayibacter oskolensis]
MQPETPTDDLSGLPGVSYVMPVLNEVTHVRAAVASLLAQDYSGPFDIVLALAPSIDGTEELVAQLSAADPRIHVVPNPVGSTPAGLNAAIRASRHPVVVRVDAHSVLPAEYARIAVEALQRSGADNVGGVMAAQGLTAFQRAVARAYGSRIGLGGTPHHIGGEEGPAETVYLGVFRRAALDRAGLFDERFKRGQDWELNRRIREQGGLVWFTPRLTVTYRPRPSLRALLRQFLSTGMWRGELTRLFPASRSLRYFAPPVLVALLALGLLAGAAGAVQALVGVAPWLLLGLAVPAGYLLLVAVATLVVAREDGPRAMLWFCVVIPAIHVAWGTGFVLGFAGLTSNIAAHRHQPKADTARGA